MTDTARYPLTWPVGWPRTSPARRERARFHGHTDRRTREITTAEGLGRVASEMAKLGARSIVISTNVELRNDGLPYSNRREPDDPGVAIYFVRDDAKYALACDKWTTVGANLAALAAHIGALRGQERWGVGTTSQAFTGYLALPPRGGTSTEARSWRDVLGEAGYDFRAAVDSGTMRTWVGDAHAKLARRFHPDAGGSASMMATINVARDEALRELR